MLALVRGDHERRDERIVMDIDKFQHQQALSVRCAHDTAGRDRH